MAEPILEPRLPIIDPHHHLWDFPEAMVKALPPSVADHGFTDIVRTVPRYLLDELLARIRRPRSASRAVAQGDFAKGGRVRGDREID